MTTIRSLHSRKPARRPVVSLVAAAALLVAGLVGCSAADDTQTETPGGDSPSSGLAANGTASSDASSQAGATDESCTPAWKFTTIVAGKLSIAAVNNPPQLDIDPSSGKATGVEADLLNKFAKLACVTITWNRLDGAAAVAAMSSGKMDIGAGGWGKTPDRGKVMGQMTEPIYTDPAAILSTSGITTIDGLKDATVGVQGGSLYQTELEKLLGSSHVRAYQTVDAEVQDLANGRIKAVYGDSIQLATAAKVNKLDPAAVHVQSPDPKYQALTQEVEVNFPYTKSNTALGDALDAFNKQEQDSGDVKVILEKWGLGQLNG